MHATSTAGAAAALAVLVWSFVPGRSHAPAAPPPEPPVADGHLVLVVEGDRTGLSITAASAKTAPWAGVPKGLASDWRLRIRDARGGVLAELPLDVSAFAVGAGELGTLRVEGCLVRDSRIAMLVNAPAFAAAAGYEFVRRGEAPDAWIALGTTTADQVRVLAGGGR